MLEESLKRLLPCSEWMARQLPKELSQCENLPHVPMQVSNFNYLGGTPPLAKVDWWVFTLNFDVLFSATFRLNDMGSNVKVWKQYRIAATIRPRP